MPEDRVADTGRIDQGNRLLRHLDDRFNRRGPRPLEPLHPYLLPILVQPDSNCPVALPGQVPSPNHRDSTGLEVQNAGVDVRVAEGIGSVLGSLRLIKLFEHRLGQVSTSIFDLLLVQNASIDRVPASDLVVRVKLRTLAATFVPPDLPVLSTTRHLVSPVELALHVADDPNRTTRRSQRRTNRPPRLLPQPRSLVHHAAVHVLAVKRVRLVPGLEPNRRAVRQLQRHVVVVVPEDLGRQPVLHPGVSNAGLSVVRRDPPEVPTLLAEPRLFENPRHASDGLATLGAGLANRNSGR